MIRILNAEPLDYHEQPRHCLRSIGQLDERELTRSELLDCLADYDVLIVRLHFQVDREMIDAGSKLKAIVTATTGLDHIDVDYAMQRGIEVLSLRGETEFLRSIPATAEHTWGLLLALIRHTPWAFRSVLDGQWDRDKFRGRDLCGKRLGIVGLGRIGHKVAGYGLAFGMQVLAYDPNPLEEIPQVTMCPTLPDLLRQSDVLSLHVPLNPETAGLIRERELALLPSGSVVINTARAAIMDEAALLNALQSGALAGAALDVVADERQQQSSSRAALIAYARANSNLLITPHISGATEDSMAATELFMANKLKHYFASTTA